VKHKMNRNNRIPLILITLVVVAVLATFWATHEPIGSPLERQGRERWDLTDEQRKIIKQLIEDMMRKGASRDEINAALDAKFSEWGIKPFALPPPGDIELFYTAKTVVSSINATLVIILLLTYIDIYRKTKSNFTVGLIMFSMILLLYTLASNPIMQWAFGFRAFGLGPFVMLPDIFACIALSVLLYLSVKY